MYYAYVRGENNNDKFEKRNTDNDGLLHWVKRARENLNLAGINEQNGSILDIWSGMEYDEDISNKELQYFRNVCEPKLTRQKIEVNDGQINVNIKLSPNEFALIKVEKLI